MIQKKDNVEANNQKFTLSSKNNAKKTTSKNKKKNLAEIKMAIKTPKDNQTKKSSEIGFLNNKKNDAEIAREKYSMNIKSEKQKQDEISGKKEMNFQDAKTHSKGIVAILLVFVLSVFSIGSVIVAGNLSNTTTISANVNNTRIVQAKLSSLGYYDKEIDGIYDKDTIDAIKNYQADKNLAVTGSLDSATTTALGVTDNAQANSDLYLLAKLIYSEARGEIYQGQVAVGAVVLNRVADAGFPNTLQGVIYQPWAFTALHDGQFSLEPNTTAYNAAQDAMNGWDPTYGCLYYYNPKTATSSWIFSRTIAVMIGNHVFCY